MVHDATATEEDYYNIWQVNICLFLEHIQISWTNFWAFLQWHGSLTIATRHPLVYWDHCRTTYNSESTEVSYRPRLAYTLWH